MKKATIKDVANMAGVSVSTVSRVLSGRGYSSDETSDRVRKAAKALNYMPNTAARSLRCEKSKNIGVVLPGISMEFYAACASAILGYATKKGYTVLFAQSGRSQSEEEEVIKALLGHRVDGMLFIGDNNDDSVIYSIKRRDIAVVTGDRRLENIPSVTFNNRETMKKLVENCLRYGCKRLVYVGTPPKADTNNLSERYMGFLDAVNGVGDIVTNYVFQDKCKINVFESAYDLFNDKILDMKPDAIIASTDQMAQGILRAAYDLKIKVPEDMIVTGFDDMKSAAYLSPSLTTVHQDVQEFAEKCFSSLEDLINGNATTSHIIEQEIIVRESAPIL